MTRARLQLPRAFAIGMAIVLGAAVMPIATPVGVATAGEAPFTDIGSSSFESQIVWLHDSGITGGCTATTFCPKATVTRGQMAAFLARALELPPATEDHFTDDATSTFQSSINRVFEAGIASGCTATTFCPTSVVTREQMAAFLSRTFDLPTAIGDHFTDDEGRPLQDHVNRLFEAGITGGCTASTFCPKNPVTREQMAAFLYRALFLEPLPEDFVTAAAGAAFHLDGPRLVPSQVSCGGDTAVNCPNGNPDESPPEIAMTGTDLTVTDVAGDDRFDFTATVAIETVEPLIVTLPLVGDCELTIDTAPGASPTLQMAGTMRFVDHPEHFRANMLTFVNVGSAGLTEDDLSLGGSFSCQIADFGLGFTVGLLDDMLTDQLAPLCGVYGPELLIPCPTP